MIYRAGPQRIALITDAWKPQVNGVVRTLSKTTSLLEQGGHEVLVISPESYHSIACPTYPEIRLALAGRRSVGAQLRDFAPDAIHIATEGPLGLAARSWCLGRGLNFTTAYHTQFPDYLARRTGLPAQFFWPFIRRFHRPSSAILTATQSIRNTLRAQGLAHLKHWGRGVDLTQFTPDAPPPEIYSQLKRPIQLYVGRVAVEKNIEAFLSARHAGSKVVVGDGPMLAQLKAQYPDVHFAGKQRGAALAGYYAGADVFVFPSRTDTFGLVMIEALACATPVAAYPVTGPRDILTPTTGVMDLQLDHAIAAALRLSGRHCTALAREFSWEKSVSQFVNALVPAREMTPLAA